MFESLPAVMKNPWFWEMMIVLTHHLCCFITRTHLSCCRSHTRTQESKLPVIIKFPYSPMAIHITDPKWPWMESVRLSRSILRFLVNSDEVSSFSSPPHQFLFSTM